ncbi:MAG: hypothetical protein ABEJ36_04795, partial [Candidatus Nanosalina sp.]
MKNTFYSRLSYYIDRARFRLLSLVNTDSDMSKDIQDVLEEKDIEVGDRVKADGYEGRLMPKPESGDPEALVIKLDSGYNIG